MKKIAAHYWLRPDGTVGKFPIITFDGDNNITEIRERDTFKEEASLLLVNGLLIPGLVDYGNPLLPASDSSALKKYLNRIAIQGVRVMGVPSDIYAHLEKVNSTNILLVQADVSLGNYDLAMGFAKIQLANDSITELMNLTIHNARAMGVDHLYGSLEVGKSPGLLAISNIDYQTFRMEKNSKLKNVI